MSAPSLAELREGLRRGFRKYFFVMGETGRAALRILAPARTGGGIPRKGMDAHAPTRNFACWHPLIGPA